MNKKENNKKIATKQNRFRWNFELNDALLIFIKLILNGFHIDQYPHIGLNT